jgi:hypothetical protein
MKTLAPDLSALITILRVGRPGDLDPAVKQVPSGLARRSIPLSRMSPGFGEEVGQFARS